MTIRNMQDVLKIQKSFWHDKNGTGYHEFSEIMNIKSFIASTPSPKFYRLA